MSRKTLLLLGGLLAVGTVVLLPVFSRKSNKSNCGGNSAALARVREYAVLARVGAMDSPDHTFRVGTVTAEQRKQLAEFAHYYWIPRARLSFPPRRYSSERQSHDG